MDHSFSQSSHRSEKQSFQGQLCWVVVLVSILLFCVCQVCGAVTKIAAVGIPFHAFFQRWEPRPRLPGSRSVNIEENPLLSSCFSTEPHVLD